MNENDLVNQFLTWKEYNQGRSARTAELYRIHLVRLAKYAGEIGTTLLALEPDDIEVFCGPYLHKKGLSAHARCTVVAAVRGLFKWATKRGLCQANPAQYLSYPKAGRKLPVPISRDDAEKLIWAPDMGTFVGVRDAAMIALLLGCGLRVSGLVSLNASGLIWTRHEKRDRLVVRVIEKGNKERLVPVPDESRLMLMAYMGHEELDRIDRTLPDGDKVLFVSTRNRNVPEHEYSGEARRITAWSVRDRIMQYGKQVGISEEVLHPHALRHLFGQELTEDDVDLTFRQALMGHDDPKSTQIYSHVSMRKLTDAIDRASPIRKIRTPVTELLARLGK